MSANLFDVQQKEKRFLVLDGGLASELEAHGLTLHDSLWSARALADNPSLVQKVHASYLEAGADIIVTSSYQATHQGFHAHGFDRQQGDRLLQTSVALARQAIQEHLATDSRSAPVLAASVGSYGAFLNDGSEYRGKFGLSEHELADFHRDRLKTIASCNPDVFACETLPCLLEARALVTRLLPEVGIPAWLSFTCQNTTTTAGGDAIEACAALAEESAHVLAVGVNCTSPDLCVDLLQKMRRETSKPLLVYPNRGEAWNSENRQFERSACAPLPTYVEAFVDAGATIIGGCCRTSPDDIRSIARASELGHQG